MRDMRNEKRKISNEEAKALLSKEGVGILATVDKDGQPYGIPVNYVYDQDHIYFHCAIEGHKLDNIRENNRVCFTVYGENQVIPQRFTTTYESTVVFGTAKEVVGEEKQRALKLIIEKFSPDFLESGLEYIERAHEKTAVVKIEIGHLTGKRSMNKA